MFVVSGGDESRVMYTNKNVEKFNRSFVNSAGVRIFAG